MFALWSSLRIGGAGWRRADRRTAVAAVTILMAFAYAAPAAPRGKPESAVRPPGTYGTLTTTTGDIVIRLLPADAPETVANFVGLAEGRKAFRDPRTGALVKRPFFDGLTFHRVVRGFLIQTGSPNGDGTSGPGYTIPDELPPRRPYARGAVLMSHGPRPNSAGSQFFILLGDVEQFLPKQYVVFGEVVQGMDVADRIAAAPTKPNRFRPSERSTPLHPVVIRKVLVTRVPAESHRRDAENAERRTKRSRR